MHIIMNDLILCLSIFVAFGLIFFSFWRLEIKDALTIAILALTALALVWTTVDASKNAAESRVADLRPVILRDGVVDWPEFTKNIAKEKIMTSFFVKTNIATNIYGYIVVNGKKYSMSFVITKNGEKPGQFIYYEVTSTSTAGWTLPDKLIVGGTFPDRFELSNEPEGFYIFYSDIEGNKYKTYEDNKQYPISSRI
jgi:hypothetical protein